MSRGKQQYYTKKKCKQPKWSLTTEHDNESHDNSLIGHMTIGHLTIGHMTISQTTIYI